MFPGTSPGDEWCPTQHGSCVKSGGFWGFFLVLFLNLYELLAECQYSKENKSMLHKRVDVGRKGGCPGFLPGFLL